MSARLRLLKENSQIRKRMLIGSVGLTLIVISIFSYLGSDMLLNLESRIAQRTFNNQLNGITHAIAKHPEWLDKTKNDPAAEPIPAYLLPVQRDLVALFLGSEIFYRSQSNASSFAIDYSSINQSTLGFASINNTPVFVNRKWSDKLKQPVVAVWLAKSHHVATNQIVNQFTLTAILTFLVAVWAAVVISALITRRFEKANRLLQKMALVDSLTHLPNRNALFNNLSLSGNTGAIFFIDLDRFKEVNDVMGHDAGDSLLIAFAQRLTEIAGEKVNVYRYRSDEFVLWHPDLPPEKANQWAFSLLYQSRDALAMPDYTFEIGCTIGVACFPLHGNNISTLLKNAENAMHRAKQLRLGIEIYNDEHGYDSGLQVALRSQLYQALQQRQFQLYYQPKVKMDSQELMGVEAIVRWHHPDEGTLLPASFIDLVEQSGIIHSFTRYTVEEAVNQIKLWSKQGFNVPVSVNLSAYNLLDDAFIGFVETLLAQTGICPSLLEFELTESATMVDIDVSKHMIKTFKQMGIKTSIDDFGTGMSSFAYLRELDVQTVKLDRSFVKNIHQGEKDERIVGGIVSLCRSLSIDIIAEGVETAKQAEILQGLDCHFAQGFLFGKPVPSALLQSLFPSQKLLAVQPA
ncbi:putative bifunctional diguanylate cyclase/phosphodiesterase [Alteromonas sp. ASW11-130]|uniref:putative bifunctional diguanylate cyclase/phosphodiesterase n=1 Tax=Alteromonas sp. ASW11-130 TaxID=3015775 RepID=UPI0022427D13|nr:bifunctional diguanylate cyclase/phosphodiesterase [Alteromonas sp. ASW11-130]MCW8090276.1 bifunctional diguanylate cyclase/phosphodiesterase [Alteromonas sp. ASW11-130]